MHLIDAIELTRFDILFDSIVSDMHLFNTESSSEHLSDDWEEPSLMGLVLDEGSFLLRLRLVFELGSHNGISQPNH